jgi:hypothetical protein
MSGKISFVAYHKITRMEHKEVEYVQMWQGFKVGYYAPSLNKEAHKTVSFTCKQIK